MIKRNIHIIPSLGYGGAETFLLRLLPKFENKNVVLTFYKTEYDMSRIKNKKIRYITLDPRRTSFRDIYLLIKLLASLNEDDIIFSWLYISDLLACFLKCIFFWKKFKIIWNVRNSIIAKDYSFFSNISFELLRKVFMFIPNKIIFNSHNAMLEHIKKGYSKEKCITIHNGYERLSKFHKPTFEKNFFKIAYVARYHPQKNHKLLLESISLYKKNFNHNFKLFLAGKNIDDKNSFLKEQISKLDLKYNVILCGILDQKKIHELFSKCDITLLLSNYGEGFPNVIAEAMLYGTFPIATDIGESKYIVNKYGRIIPPNSDPLLISSLINDFEKMKRNSFSKWQAKVFDCQEFSKERFSLESISKSFNYITNNI